MRISKWGNSLAVRIPKDVADKLGISEGDEVDFVALEDRSIGVTRPMSLEEAVKSLRKYRGRMPAGFRFDRDEANAR